MQQSKSVTLSFAILCLSLSGQTAIAQEKPPKTDQEIAAFCSAKDYEKRIKEITPKEVREELAHKCFTQPTYKKSKPKSW